jgi:hypothetical protein
MVETFFATDAAVCFEAGNDEMAALEMSEVTVTLAF